MWRRAFVATSVALGSSLAETLAALPDEDMPETVRLPSARAAPCDELVMGLRAPTRPVRAAALAGALHDVLLGVDELALR